MNDEYQEPEEERALAENGQNKGSLLDGASVEDRIALAGKLIDAGRELGGKALDSLDTMEICRVRMAEVIQKARESENSYNLAKNQLRVLEDTLKENFAERKLEIEKEFSLIDKALEAGNWDAVVKIFDSGTKMVATSPLETIAERKAKFIKNRRNITSFDDI